MNQAALAHLGERQTEVHLSPALTCDFWRYCVRSTEAAVSFALSQAISAVPGQEILISRFCLSTACVLHRMMGHRGVRERGDQRSVRSGCAGR